MSGEEKNKLDELFKSGLDAPDTRFDYHDQDWANMEQLLDAGKKPRAIVYWLPILSGVAAVLLLFFGWWFFKPVKVAQQQQIAANHAPVTRPLNPANNKVNTNNNTVVNTPDNKTSQPAQVLKPQTVPAYASIAVKHNNHSIQQLSKGTAKNVTVIADNSGKPADGTANKNDVLANKVNQTQAQQNPANSVSTTTATNSIAAVETPAKEVQTTAPVSADATPAIAGNQKIKKTVRPAAGRRGPQFGLAILVSPDINGAGSFQNAKVGTNIGVLFSVSVSKKLTISTGASYSKKPYMTDFDNYHSNYKFKTDPENVYADCRVLDIPLNVDYKLYSKSKNSFSVGSGLSSYIMLKEKYSYDYAVPNTPGPAGYTVNNRNRHILGVLNLNATYQHQLNSKFSIAAQPYLKVPLTKIGYSQVKLQSAGVAVGLRWNINQSITP